MLTFALLAVALTAIVAVVGRSIGAQASAVQKYEDASMARAVLEEYIATYPALPARGGYGNYWEWSISEKPAKRLRPSKFDNEFDIVEVTVSVTRSVRLAKSYQLRSIVARKGASQ